MKQGGKERYPLGRAVRQGIMLGATIWGAGQAIEAKPSRVAELFANRPSLSQTFSGDVGLTSRSGRPNNIEVTFWGKPVAAIPASAFGEAQGRFDEGHAQESRQGTQSTHRKTGPQESWYAHVGTVSGQSATEALRTRVALASISAQEPPRNEQRLPFNTFDELSPVAYAVLLPFGKFNKRRATLLLSLSALLASCATPMTAIPMTEIAPATPVPVEVTGTPLVNEVLTSTPVPRLETPVVVDGSYPTAISQVESPKVYSYGGPEGRENMDEITRAMFDRYIAELAREGRITGSTPEALYLDFDKKFDFKMYVTDQMLTRIIQQKSDGDFLVPENMVGQVYRELQLSYNDLFQGGAPIEVGTDNFGLREFQADRVGGVGAWPVLVNVDDQSIPVSWLDMERGGMVTPLESSVSVNNPEVTPIPQGGSPEPASTEPGATRVVQENGHHYVYRYTKLGETETGEELWGYVREVGVITLLDTPYINYLPFKISIADGVESEQNFVSVRHRDRISNEESITPLDSTFRSELQNRYFEGDPRKSQLSSKELQQLLQIEMQGLGEGDHTQAYLDIIVANGTPEGEVKRVKLSETTGIILTIMTPEDIATLGGEDVLELHAQGDGRNYTYFVHVYDVDEKGNELARVAFQDPLSQIPEEILRKVLFSIPGNLIDHKDQREQGFTNVAQIFAQYSAKTNEVTGKPDVEIELLPTTPVLTTPTP